MSAILITCIIFLMFVTCIILVIFAPKKHVFYNIKNHCPYVLKCFNDAQISLINKEIDTKDWESVEDLPLNKNASYKKIELYADGEYLVDIKKYPQTSNIISQIEGLRKAYLLSLGPKTILKVQKDEHPILRISIPLQNGFYNVDHCGIWVKRETRCLYKKIMYDPSNIYSMYNKSLDEIKTVVLELDKPSNLP